MTPRRRIGLELKVVAVLLVIALVPLAVSALLVAEIGRVAQSFASNEAARTRPHLERAQGVYRELITSKKELFQEKTRRWAADPRVAEAAAPPWPAAAPDDEATPAPEAPVSLDVLMAEILAGEPAVHGVAVREADGALVAERERAPRTPAGDNWRELAVTAPIAGTGRVLELDFAANLDWPEELAELGRVTAHLGRIETVRTSLPDSYRAAFLLLVGGVVLVVTLTGILLARRLTGRIATLVGGTREVAAGNLAARVQLAGRDELAELAFAFNRMVEDLEHDRRQINYLQRVSAWQDVARKLAHEIKNPLTPIQLAVQQCVSSYQGGEARFRRLLADTQEIVGEEIGNLRRLVDAFRDLGSLPPVAPVRLDVATVIADLETEPAFADRLEVRAPPAPVTVLGDRLLLRRVLHNLVENGLQAGAAAGRAPRVVVAWAGEAGAARAVITVDDAGPGIEPEARERIFEPYITTKETGTGLGLTISKKIALDHGGTLEVAPEPAPAPLGGARFVLRLPLADRDAPSGGG